MKASHPYPLFLVLAVVHVGLCLSAGSPLLVRGLVGFEAWNMNAIALWGSPLILIQGIGYYVLRIKSITTGLVWSHILACLASLLLLWFFIGGSAGWWSTHLIVTDVIAACIGLHGLGLVCYLLNMSIELLAKLLR